MYVLKRCFMKKVFLIFLMSFVFSAGSTTISTDAGSNLGGIAGDINLPEPDKDRITLIPNKILTKVSFQCLSTNQRFAGSNRISGITKYVLIEVPITYKTGQTETFLYQIPIQLLDMYSYHLRQSSENRNLFRDYVKVFRRSGSLVYSYNNPGTDLSAETEVYGSHMNIRFNAPDAAKSIGEFKTKQLISYVSISSNGLNDWKNRKDHPEWKNNQNDVAKRWAWVKTLGRFVEHVKPLSVLGRSPLAKGWFSPKGTEGVININLQIPVQPQIVLLSGQSYFWNLVFVSRRRPSFSGNQNQGYLLGCQYFTSPLMLFFSEDRPRFTAVSSFPLNEGGSVMWPEKNSPGYFLAFDRNKNGTIDKAYELFGVKGQNNALFKNGFESLETLDHNKDKKITKADPEFSKLVLWKDENLNGVGEKSEQKSLSEMGVQLISLEYKYSENQFGRRAKAKEKSYFKFVDSKGQLQTGEVVDIWLAPVN